MTSCIGVLNMLHITFSKYDCIIVHKAYYVLTCTCVSINSFHSHSHSHMIHHGFAPQALICANIIPILKSAKGALTCSDKYRSIAISSVIGKILDHIIIDRQSEFLKTSDYPCGFKPKSSTILCSTMVNETIQYYTENGGKRVYVLLYSMLPRPLIESLLKFYLIYYLIKMYAPRLFSYYILCIQTNYVMLSGEVRNQQVFLFQMG